MFVVACCVPPTVREQYSSGVVELTRSWGGLVGGALEAVGGSLVGVALACGRASERKGC